MKKAIVLGVVACLSACAAMEDPQNANVTECGRVKTALMTLRNPSNASPDAILTALDVSTTDKTSMIKTTESCSVYYMQQGDLKTSAMMIAVSKSLQKHSDIKKSKKK